MKGDAGTRLHGPQSCVYLRPNKDEYSVSNIWYDASGCGLVIAFYLHLKALVFLYALEESVDYHLLSSFCDDSNLHISLFKYALSTMSVSKETISKFLIGNRFHVKLRILSPYSNRI